MAKCFLSEIDTDKISILRQVSNHGMLIQKLKRLLLSNTMLDQLTNGPQAITAIGMGRFTSLLDHATGVFVAQVQ